MGNCSIVPRKTKTKTRNAWNRFILKAATRLHVKEPSYENDDLSPSPSVCIHNSGTLSDSKSLSPPTVPHPVLKHSIALSAVTTEMNTDFTTDTIKNLPHEESWINDTIRARIVQKLTKDLQAGNPTVSRSEVNKVYVNQKDVVEQAIKVFHGTQEKQSSEPVESLHERQEPTFEEKRSNSETTPSDETRKSKETFQFVQKKLNIKREDDKVKDKNEGDEDSREDWVIHSEDSDW
jgi:hypothetical protein